MKELKMKVLMDKAIISQLSEETRNKIIELIKQDKNNIIKKKQDILDNCVKEKLIKKSEIKDYSQDYLVEYLNILLDSKTDNIPIPEDIKKRVEKRIKQGKKFDKKIVFITTNAEILERKDELNNKFNKYILVQDTLEAMNDMQESDMQEDEEGECENEKDKVDYIG